MMRVRLFPLPHCTWWAALAGLAMLLMVQATLLADEVPVPGTEIYQDFRNQTPLLPSFALAGPDLYTVIKPEEGGLRVTRLGTEAEHYPVAVISKFTLSGDFEATGTYEILSATQPKEGYGVGVVLSVTTDPGRRKFAKVSRLLLPKAGDVYKTEFWNTDQPKAYKAPSVPTKVKSGKLRLVREGEKVRCLVADGADENFRQLLQVPFGTDELPHLDFSVTDSGGPGNAVDVRLIDLRVRSGKPLPIPAVVPEPSPVTEKAVSKGSLLIVQIIGGVITMLLLGLATWLVFRRRGGLPATAPTAVVEPATISFACPGCKKTMKTPATLAGKKGKCRHCGQAVLVPHRAAGEPEPT